MSGIGGAPSDADGDSESPLPIPTLPRYPLDALYEEIAYIAYHFHWSRDEIMEMEHRERHRWVKEISRINERLTKGGGD